MGNAGWFDRRLADGELDRWLLGANRPDRRGDLRAIVAGASEHRAADVAALLSRDRDRSSFEASRAPDEGTLEYEGGTLLALALPISRIGQDTETRARALDLVDRALAIGRFWRLERALADWDRSLIG